MVLRAPWRGTGRVGTVGRPEESPVIATAPVRPDDLASLARSRVFRIVFLASPAELGEIYDLMAQFTGEFLRAHS